MKYQLIKYINILGILSMILNEYLYGVVVKIPTKLKGFQKSIMYPISTILYTYNAVSPSPFLYATRH